jgi:ribosome-binding factor A
MANRPERIAEAIRDELSTLLARDVHDPGIGFITLTMVKVAPDLQLARVYYTSMGDEKALKATAKALGRATPFLRRQVAQRLRLRRVPELQFFYDESIANQDRIEQILQDLKAEATAQGDVVPETDLPARNANGAPPAGDPPDKDARPKD